MGLKDDAGELKDILNQLKGTLNNVNLGGENFSKSLKESSDRARELNEEMVNNTSEIDKQIEKSKQKSQTDSEHLKNVQKINQQEQANLQSIKDKLSEEIKSNKLLARKIKEEKQSLLEKQKSGKLSGDESKQLSTLNQQHQGITKTISDQASKVKDLTSKLGDTEEAAEDLEDSLKHVTKQEEAAKKAADSLKKGFNNIFGGPSSQIMDMINPLKMIADLIGGLVGGVKEYDKRLGDTAKSMNITYEEAEKSNKAMERFSRGAEDASKNTENINKATVELNKTLGTTVKFEEMGAALQEDVALMGQLQASAGLTADETNAIMKFSLGTGKEATKVTKQIMAGYKFRGLESKLMLNEKEAMKEISKLSKATMLSISGGAEGLGKAMASAKALGTDLGKVDDIAGSLLNFEQSIANELEAELLTGKELNLEKARQAAMDGELGILADEIAENIGSAADFTKMNRVQQEAMAAAVGMTREELAGTLMEQEALKNVQAESVEDAYSQLAALETQEEKQAFLNQLGNDSLANQLEQRSIAEEKAEKEKKFQDTMIVAALNMTKIKDTFKEIYDNIMKIIDKLGGMKTIMMVIGGIIGFKMAKGIMDYGAGVGKAIKAAKALAAAEKGGGIASIIKGAWSSLGGLPVVGPVLAGAAIAAAVGYLMSQMSSAESVNDMFSPGGGGGGYGSRMLTGPEGVIALNNKDDIIAGTDLFKKGNDVTSEGGGATKTGAAGSVSVGPDMSSVVAAINSLGAKVEAMANRPINVGMDGQKVIEAGTGNNPNTFGEEVGKNSFDLQ